MADLGVLIGVPKFREWVKCGASARSIKTMLESHNVTGYSVDAIKRARQKMLREEVLHEPLS